LVADDMPAFTHAVIGLMENRAMQRQMGEAARRFSLAKAWDGVFDQVYTIYETGLATIGRAPRQLTEVSVAQ
jgi:hypothetical protein